MPSLRVGRNTCYPTVRYGSTRTAYNWVHIEDPPPPVKLLPIFCTLPTLASTIKFLYSSRLESLFQPLTEHGHEAEFRYFFTGREPRPPIQDTHLPTNVDSHPEELTVSRPPDQVVVGGPSTPQPLHSPELAGADGSRTACGTIPVNTVCDRV